MIHIPAVHPTELRSAIVQYMSLGNWTVGSAPSSSRQTSARDINDLRGWTDQFSTARAFPSGPAFDPQGVVSFTYDPTISYPGLIDQTGWVGDVRGLQTQRTPTIRVKSVVKRGDLANNYPGYELAFGYYQGANVPTYALLDPQFYLQQVDGGTNGNLNDALLPQGGKSNPFIDNFSTYAQNFASALIGYGLKNYFIWNEPNNFSPGNNDAVPIDPVTGRVDPFVALLYQCYTKLKQVSGIGVVFTGGILWPYNPAGGCDANCATSAVGQYLTAMYESVRGLGITTIPWDGLNVHIHDCGFSDTDIRNLRLEIDLTRYAQAQPEMNPPIIDHTPIVVGEWGPTHGAASGSATCLSDAFTHINTYFDDMWYFQHPNRTTTGDCSTNSSDYGLTSWFYLVEQVGGNTYNVANISGHCPEYSQLKTVLS